jgi:hypothetical protein
MYLRTMGQLASQRTNEIRRSAGSCRAHHAQRGPRIPIRHQAGWALIEIGLRLANSSGDA